MADQVELPTKLFTVEEANAMLPLVRAIVADIVRLSRDIVERRQRLMMLAAGRELKDGDPYSAELAAVEDDLQQSAKQLQGYVEELTALGVEPKGLSDGLVDFPAMMEGRLVWLCWKYNEPEVAHWHEWDAGFSGRQPLSLQGCVPASGSETE